MCVIITTLTPVIWGCSGFSGGYDCWLLSVCMSLSTLWFRPLTLSLTQKSEQ